MSDHIEWRELAGLVEGIASLATVTPAGEAHVAVVSTALADGAIWIGSDRSARKTINVGANPSVALVWSGAAETYVWGEADLVDEVAVKQAMWADAWSYDPAMFFQTPDNPDYVLIRVQPQRAMMMRFGDDGPEQRRWTAPPEGGA